MLQTMLGAKECQAVQGSTYIRNTSGCTPSAWLARYLDAEPNPSPNPNPNPNPTPNP